MRIIESLNTKKLNDFTIVANAMYAKQTYYLKYEEIDKYKKLLCELLIEKYKYIMYEASKSNIIEEEDHIFVRLNEGILSVDQLEKSFIDSINSIYPKEYQEIIKKSYKLLNSEK